MKAETEVLAMILFFFAGVAFHAIVDGKAIGWLLTALVAPAATLLAAYLGAKYAFDYQERTRKSLEIERQATALNLAVFELARAGNMFHQIDAQFIDPHRNNPARHLHIQPAAGATWIAPNFDFAALSFLFHSSDPNILGQLSSFEREVDSTLEVIRERSRYYFEHVADAAERAEARFGDQLTPNQVEGELGHRHTVRIVAYTNFMVEGVANVKASAKRLSKQLTALGLESLPQGTVITYRTKDAD